MGPEEATNKYKKINAPNKKKIFLSIFIIPNIANIPIIIIQIKPAPINIFLEKCNSFLKY